VPQDALVRAVIAWTQLFGMISFELFGQFVGSFEPADALFHHAVAQLASFVGFRQRDLLKSHFARQQAVSGGRPRRREAGAR
jgi:Tetracyclin repressor-like, C-terminal domain